MHAEAMCSLFTGGMFRSCSGALLRAEKLAVVGEATVKSKGTCCSTID
jgi:hypothetical protein